MCTLDWSSINDATRTWIPIVILTSTVIPYLTAMFASLALVSSTQSKDSFKLTFPTCVSCLTGSLLGLVFASLYYVTRLLMHNFIAVNRVIYILGSFSYFLNPLWFTLTILLSRRLCPKK